MRGRMRSAAVVALAAGLVTAAGVTGAQAASSIPSCPSGYVCIAPQEPGGKTFNYSGVGYHNLLGLVGTFLVINNTSGPARFCLRFNGLDCCVSLSPQAYENIDLTPIRSLVIES